MNFFCSRTDLGETYIECTRHHTKTGWFIYLDSGWSSAEDYFFKGVGFGQGSESFIMKKYSSLPSFYENQDLAIPSVPLTILVETGFLGLFFYILLIPLVIKNNNNFYKKSVMSIFMILIIIQLTQYFDISLFRFHPLTFIFAIYLGVGCNKNLKFNA